MMLSSSTPVCQPISAARVDRLFAQWNAALQSGDPEKVADTYARSSILLPTLSRTPRISRDETIDYFKEFLKKRPVGTINTSVTTTYVRRLRASTTSQCQPMGT